ncbi:MAG TPA: MarR family transcriptional regulator [Mycobacterium sp.]|nr:MarR family transcriptional regulator [Mycobacterium sp.]
MPRSARTNSSVAGQIARAAELEGPEFDPTVLALTLTMFRTATAFERAHAAELVPHGLNTSQLNILTVLDRAPEPLTMGALGQAVAVRPANLTGVVDGLVERQLLERISNPDDRRSFLIRISTQGRAFLRKFLPGHWTYLQQLMDGLTQRQKQQLQSLLDRFFDSIEAATAGGVNPVTLEGTSRSGRAKRVAAS